MEQGKVPAAVQKVNKKHVKDELDHIKQPEKKVRHLEKALGTSTAVRAWKKRNRKRKMNRALMKKVLLGEDSDNSSQLKKDEGLNKWEATVPRRNISVHSLEGTGLVSDAYTFGHTWSGCANTGWTLPSASFGAQYSEHECLGPVGIAADLISKQAISFSRLVKTQV